MRLLLIAALLLAPPAPAEAAEETASGALRILPAAHEVPGWRPDGEALEFEPDDLWEYINGQAESFLMYEFQAVAAAHYLDGDAREVKIEVYEHSSPLMAFGIYTQFRRPDGEFFDIGAEAFGDEYSLHFWKGRYYVRINAYDDDEASRQALHSFGKAAAAKIEYAGGEPADLALFPPHGLVARSAVYVTRGVMGSGRMPAAFVSDYLREGESGKLYLLRLGGEAEAAELIEWYAGQIGAEVREVSAEGVRYHSGAGEAPYRGRVLAFRRGNWLGIATGFAAQTGIDEQLAAETAALIARFEHE